MGIVLDNENSVHVWKYTPLEVSPLIQAGGYLPKTSSTCVKYPIISEVHAKL